MQQKTLIKALKMDVQQPVKKLFECAYCSFDLEDGMERCPKCGHYSKVENVGMKRTLMTKKQSEFSEKIKTIRQSDKHFFPLFISFSYPRKA